MKLSNFLNLLFYLVLTSAQTVEENNLPSFSLASGFYNEESIELEIKAPNPNAVIYYTLDGSIPNENSTIYENPFILKDKSNEDNVLSNHLGIAPNRNFTPPVKIKKGHVIRAMAKLPDGELTNVVSRTYYVGLNKNELYQDNPVINIITDPDNLFDYEKGIYIMGKTYDDWLKEDPKRINNEDYLIDGNYNKSGRESERPATIEYIPGNENIAVFSQDVGIRLKGKATRTYYQKSFHITSREEYGKKNMKFEFIPGNMRADGKGPVTKYKTFNLRNGGNDSEFGKIRDMLLQDLVQNDYFETQQSDFAVVFIDGEYWGVYNVYEDYSDHYIGNNYDIDNKNVVVIKSYKVESGEDEDIKLFEDTVNYLRTTNMTIPENYEEAKRQFDMEGYVWYAAFYAYIDVQDGWYIGGNWAMWRVRDPDNSVPKADGKWRMMTFDTEFSTGLYGDGTNYKSDIIKQVLNKKSFIVRQLGGAITNSLLNNEEFKTMYINALCDMKNIHFEPKRVKKAIDEKENILLPLMKDHILRNGPDWALEDPEVSFKDQVKLIRDWLNGRDSVFMKFIQDDFGFQPPNKVIITANDFNMGSFIVNNMNEFHEEYSGEYFKENILYITAKPNSGRKVKAWKLKNCNLANRSKLSIGIYPKKGCTVTIDFK